MKKTAAALAIVFAIGIGNGVYFETHDSAMVSLSFATESEKGEFR